MEFFDTSTSFFRPVKARDLSTALLDKLRRRGMGPFPPALRVLIYRFTGKSTASLQVDYWLDGKMMHPVLPSPTVSVTEAAWRDATPESDVEARGSTPASFLVAPSLPRQAAWHHARRVGRAFRRKRRDAKKRLVARLARRDQFAYRRLVE
ncbi:hypothetical protein ACRE_004690 [Hapsidospora chrysogenum ATCC 11550]|uniref:Uncharacterized protein n=1 Tax=Hapsidospora chrysogenum (strain ATCC 11550 / CBS 779.69 / DSM 880 / IAM 14645 / JCM 23072 / IMI 49137) TaxID=857340 RepID=A0A086THG3_HAPC1|nr:hypothetical protein ACRE_004690 [Hapsidospora chrysogenum ATCC 11550]